MRLTGTAAAAGLALALSAGVASAHPHVFVDATIGLRFDDEGRLAAIQTVWTYDEFYTLYSIEVLEMDRDGDGNLTEEELLEMAKLHTEAPDLEPEDFPSQLFLETGGERTPLALPSRARAWMNDGRLVIYFERALETPADPAAGMDLKLYDPSYFIAYTITAEPEVEALPENCRARLKSFEADAALAETQARLLDLSAEQTPDDPFVGALFSDEVLVRCE